MSAQYYLCNMVANWEGREVWCTMERNKHRERMVKFNDSSGVILSIQALLNAKIANNWIINTHPQSHFASIIYCMLRIIKSQMYNATHLVLAMGLGLDHKHRSVQSHTNPETQPAHSSKAKPGPVPINPRVSLGLARHVGSNLRFCISGFHIYGRIQMCYC